MFGVIRAGECHVWWADAFIVGEPLGVLLDGGELERAAAFLKLEDRLRFTAAHGLARLVLGGHLGCAPAAVALESRCSRCGGRHGKPRVRETAERIDYSLSHSGRLVVVAATVHAQVGVDVELVAAEHGAEDLVAVMLSAAEADAFAQVAPTRRSAALLTTWTRKEAVLKATGDGLTVPPASIEVSGADEPPRLLAWNRSRPSGTPIFLHDLELIDEYVGALAVIAWRNPTVVERHFSTL